MRGMRHSEDTLGIARVLYSLGVARGQIIGINCENWISGRVSFCLRDTKTNPKLDLAKRDRTQRRRLAAAAGSNAEKESCAARTAAGSSSSSTQYLYFVL